MSIEEEQRKQSRKNGSKRKDKNKIPSECVQDKHAPILELLHWRCRAHTRSSSSSCGRRSRVLYTCGRGRRGLARCSRSGYCCRLAFLRRPEHTSTLLLDLLTHNHTLAAHGWVGEHHLVQSPGRGVLNGELVQMRLRGVGVFRPSHPVGRLPAGVGIDD